MIAQKKASRFDYVAYDEKSASDQAHAKEAFQEVERVIDLLPPGRAQALAYTKLEESYMWVGKAIRDEQLTRVGAYALQEERKNG